jgi:hypothetical protein
MIEKHSTITIRETQESKSVKIGSDLNPFSKLWYVLLGTKKEQVQTEKNFSFSNCREVLRLSNQNRLENTMPPQKLPFSLVSNKLRL